MTKRRWQLVLILLALTVAAVGVGGMCFWQFRSKPWLVFEKTRYGHMRQIAAGASGFITDENRLPTGLSEIVEAGYLPEVSPVYECPLLHNSLRDNAIAYSHCEFDIGIEPNEFIVALPQSVIDRYDWGAQSEDLVKCRVDRSGRSPSF